MFEPLKNAQYSIVSNDPEWFEGFPDVDIAVDGTYICVFRRSLGLVGKNHTLMISKSPDGLNWSKAQVFAAPRDEAAGEFWNCPKIQRFTDGTLEITCDFHDLYLLQQEPCIYYWRSTDNGNNWVGPSLHDIYGIMPTDYMINPHNPNEWGIGMHYRDDKTHRLKHVIYRSADAGQSWWAEETLAADGIHDYSEASPVFVRVNFEGAEILVLMAFIRDDIMLGDKGSPMQLAISYNFARSWQTPREVPIVGHRPIAKFLADGRLLMTYRDVGGNRCTGLWVTKINSDKLVPTKRAIFNEVFTEQKFYSIEVEDSGTHFEDFGYSGWVQNPKDGSIVVVYYTRKNAENCYIKAAKFNPTDI